MDRGSTLHPPERVLTFGETAQATCYVRSGPGCWCNRDLATIIRFRGITLHHRHSEFFGGELSSWHPMATDIFYRTPDQVRNCNCQCGDQRLPFCRPAACKIG